MSARGSSSRLSALHGVSFLRISLLAVLAFAAMGLGLGGGLGWASSQSAEGQAVYTTPTVAFFDLHRCFKESVRTRNKIDQIEAAKIGANDNLTKIQDELKKTEEKRRLVQPGSDKDFEYVLQINKLKSEVDTISKYRTEQYLQQFFEFRQNHWDEIRREVARYSEEQGIEIVLLKSIPRREEGDSEESWEIVFHASPRFDITDAIISRINRDQ